MVYCWNNNFIQLQAIFEWISGKSGNFNKITNFPGTHHDHPDEHHKRQPAQSLVHQSYRHLPGHLFRDGLRLAARIRRRQLPEQKDEDEARAEKTRRHHDIGATSDHQLPQQQTNSSSVEQQFRDGDGFPASAGHRCQRRQIWPGWPPRRPSCCEIG